MFKKFKKKVKSVINFRRVTHFRLCLLETQVVCGELVTSILYFFSSPICLQGIFVTQDPLPLLSLSCAWPMFLVAMVRRAIGVQGAELPYHLSNFSS